MNNFRIAIIGCGAVAEKVHYPAFNKEPGVQVSSFVDINIKRAKVMARTCGASYYSSIDELFKSELPDGIVVCTSNAYHTSAVIKLLNKGIHVLCEKPLASTPEEIERIMEAESKSTASVMVSHNQRFNFQNILSKNILDSGELGQVLSFEVRFSHRGPEYWALPGGDNWMQEGRVGVTEDLAIHKVDLIHWLLEQNIDEVSCMKSTRHKRGKNGEYLQADDTSFSLLRTSSGILGSLNVNWTNYGRLDDSMSFYCEKGVLRINNGELYDIVIDKRGNEKKCYTTSEMDDTKPATRVVKSFIKMIQTGDSVVTSREAYSSQKVVSKLIELQGTAAKIEYSTTDPSYSLAI